MYAQQTSEGHYVVVEAVGGKNNPNIVPVEILHIKKTKWEQWVGVGKTIGEMLFDKDPKKLLSLDVEFNKKTELLRRNLLQMKPLQVLRILLGLISWYHRNLMVSI